MKETLALLEAARAVVKDRMDYYRWLAHPADQKNDAIIKNYLPDEVRTLSEAIEKHPLKDVHLMPIGSDAWFEGKVYTIIARGDRPDSVDLHPLKGQGGDSWRNVPYGKLKPFRPIGG
jgi:hypothetical protein